MDDGEISNARMEGRNFAHRLRRKLRDLSGLEGVKQRLDDVVSALHVLVHLILQSVSFLAFFETAER